MHMTATKFWIALLIAIANFIRIYAGFDLGIDEPTATAIVGALTAFLVWLIPNRPKPPNARPFN